MKVFIDTGAFLAISDKSDTFHKKASDNILSLDEHFRQYHYRHTVKHLLRS
jgi:predicted nucleic acid-binding protein